MIHFTNGNLFEKVNDVDAIINTVNCVGVMGKGIALEFKKRYPQNFYEYKQACEKNELQPGKILTFINNLNNTPKYILNFPTKVHWRYPSKIEYIEMGLDALKEEIKKHSIKSIAMPALGCGNGGLDWNDVKPIIVNKLSDLKLINFYIYEPNKSKPKNKSNIKITKSRALLMLLIDHFNSSPFKQKVTYQEVNHLAFLTQSLGAKLNLNFTETSSGPFDNKLNKLLLALSENNYILIEKSQQKENFIKINPKKFKQKKSVLNDQETYDLYNKTLELLKGFESKERLKTLTLAVWFHNNLISKNNKEIIPLIYDNVTQWFIRENLTFSESVINEAIQRVIALKSPQMENLRLDI